MICCPWQERVAGIGDLIRVYSGKKGRTIVFTNTKKEANEIAVSPLISVECKVRSGLGLLLFAVALRAWYHRRRDLCAESTKEAISLYLPRSRQKFGAYVADTLVASEQTRAFPAVMGGEHASRLLPGCISTHVRSGNDVPDI